MSLSNVTTEASTTTWNIDPSHSAAGFTVRHMVIAKVHGKFTRFSGALKLDEKDLTKSSVAISIDAASVDTSEEKRDAHLRSADFFDADNHPKLEFKSKRIEKVGGEKYKVTGDLTIHGTTHEVVADVDFEGKGKDPWGNQRVAFSGKTSINRSDFGLKWNQALETGGLLVSEKVEIAVEVQAIKA